MKIPAKSAIVGRMPRVEGNEFKTLFIKIFDDKDPLKTGGFPKEELTFENIEKVVFEKCIPVYFLEGNDLILDNLEEIEVLHDGSIVRISC
jgi:hypothetical protein